MTVACPLPTPVPLSASKVRRKLAASLRGEPLEDSADSHQGKQEQKQAATKRETGKRKGGGGGTRDDYEKVGELDRPLLLTKAIEMLVTAMVLLPGGAVEDAMHCVRSDERDCCRSLAVVERIHELCAFAI